MRIFAQKAHLFLKKNGYLATVIGEPLAKNFSDFEVLSKVYSIFEEEGFELFWQSSRDIQWVRNYGVSKLKHESIAVHIKR